MYKERLDPALLSKPERMVVDVIAHKATRIIWRNHVISHLRQGLGDIIRRKASLCKQNDPVLSLTQKARIPFYGKKKCDHDNVRENQGWWQCLGMKHTVIDCNRGEWPCNVCVWTSLETRNLTGFSFDLYVYLFRFDLYGVIHPD